MDALSVLAYINNANKEEQRAIKDQNMANALVEFMGMKSAPPETMLNQQGVKQIEQEAITPTAERPFSVNAPQPAGIMQSLPVNREDALNQRKNTLLEQIAGSESGQKMLTSVAQAQMTPKASGEKNPWTKVKPGSDPMFQQGGALYNPQNPVNPKKLYDVMFDAQGAPIKHLGEAAMVENPGYMRPQQSQLVHPTTGEPLVFDPKTNSYIVATGAGRATPRAKTLPAELTDNLAGGVTFLGQMDKIEKMYNAALAGPAQGNIEKAYGMIANNPEFQGLRLNTATLRTLVYQLSGKQINESEQKWLEGDILPSLTQPNQNFKAKFKELKSWMFDKLKNQVNTFDSSYIVPDNIKSFVSQYESQQSPNQGGLGDIQSAAAAELARRRKGK